VLIASSVNCYLSPLISFREVFLNRKGSGSYQAATPGSSTVRKFLSFLHGRGAPGVGDLLGGLVADVGEVQHEGEEHRPVPRQGGGGGLLRGGHITAIAWRWELDHPENHTWVFPGNRIRDDSPLVKTPFIKPSRCARSFLWHVTNLAPSKFLHKWGHWARGRVAKGDRPVTALPPPPLPRQCSTTAHRSRDDWAKGREAMGDANRPMLFDPSTGAWAQYFTSRLSRIPTAACRSFQAQRHRRTGQEGGWGAGRGRGVEGKGWCTKREKMYAQ